MKITENILCYVWLQGMGACKGKLAGEVQIGDVLGWNTGSTSTVVEVRDASKSFVEIVEEYTDLSGKLKRSTSPRRMRKDRAVAIVENERFAVLGLTKDEFDMEQRWARAEVKRVASTVTN